MTNNDSPSFGEALRNLRKRQSLTQQNLAGAVGVHRNAIGRWERGDVLPKSKAIVLELAKQLRLSDRETRQLLEASLIAISPHWLVPFPRNLFFTGREEILEDLHRQLGDQQVVALTQSLALSGLGGVGKTQIALEYAYRYGLEYTAVFWIAAETEEQIVAYFLRIAEALQLPGHDDKDQQRVVKMVKQWLEAHQQWLLIWDNVEDLSLLERFLPASRSGAILLTTRRHALGILALGMDLRPMESQEGIRLLLRRAKLLGAIATEEQVQQFAQQKPCQYAAAVEIVEILAGLPLAIDQAGAYLEETPCDLRTYRNLLHTQRAALLKQRGEGSGQQHPVSVFKTFTLALEATTKKHPAVGDLLRVCALLQADAIPEELFLQGGVHLGPVLQAACADPLEWNRVVAVACAYSLLHRQPEERTFSLHRLVQAVLLDSLPPDERKLWVQRTIEAVAAVFPGKAEYANWEQYERLLPHALLCISWLDREEHPTPAGIQMFAQTGTYLRERGRYAEAEPLLEHALAMAEQQLETEHLDTATILNNLAILYKEQGKYALAEPLYRRALAIRERQLGAEHLDTAISLNGLAIIYKKRGKYEQAEALYQRALAIRERQLGAEHLDTAASLDNLAILYWQQGKYEQAEALYQRTLAIRERQLGAEHPDTARILDNLAILYWQQGKYKQAEPMCQRALSIRERRLGAEHPDTARNLSNLANLYGQQGKYEQAELMCQRALAIRERQLGIEHPDTAASLANLANLYYLQSEYEQAEPLYQRALHIYEQQLGAEHPDTAASLNGLAGLYYRQGKCEQAEPMYQRALAIKEKLLGVKHLDTAYTLQGLAVLHRDRGDENAERLFVRALAIFEHQLEATHPDLAETWHEFAIFRQQQGQWDEALSFYRRALAARAHTLGPAHVTTLDTRKCQLALLQDLVCVRQQQGKRDEALAFAEEALQVCSYLPEEADPLAVAIRTLHAQLLQENSEPQHTAISEIEQVAMPDIHIQTHSGESASLAHHTTIAPLASPTQPLQGFLDACCELHPQAWCSSADLWRAYVRWAEVHERFPLTRRALSRQLKTIGCQEGRTSAVRIWRGIAIVSETVSQKLTEHDGK